MIRSSTAQAPANNRLGHRLRVCLLLTITYGVTITSGGEVDDVYDKWLPQVLSRMGEIRQMLVPVDEATLAEAMFHAGSYYIPVDSESADCRNHSSWMFQSFIDQEIWALKMVDAGSKLPSGLLDGNFMDLGSFDECLFVEAPNSLFRGQHCVVETRGIFPADFQRAIEPQQRQFLPQITRSFMLSVCVPSSCSARDVKVHMDVALNSVNATAVVTEDSCSSRLPTPWLTRELAALFFIAVIIWSITLSTIYDIKCNQSERGDKWLRRVLCAFSLRRNVPRMLDTRQSPEALSCLNGLRVVGMAWVILGHRVLNMIGFPFLRFKNITWVQILPTLRLAPILSGQLAVEVFFLMTGVLLSYSLLRYHRKGVKFNLVQFYLYRYIRLTPALAAVMVLYGTVMVRVTEGPLWKRIFAPFRDDCLNHWWTSLAYLSNYLNPYEICVPQTWYLSADFQLYLASPLVLLPLLRRPKSGLGIAALLMALTTAAAIVNAFQLDLKAGGLFTVDRRTELAQVSDYIVTHLRASSFLMGLALGYLLFRIKQEEITLKLSKLAVAAGWTASSVLVVASVVSITVFHQPGYAPSPWIDPLYLVFQRHVFSIGLVWIIFACSAGYGGFVDAFLSWPGFTPLARLTYCAYLTHVLIQLVDTGTQRSPISLIWPNMWYHFGGDVALSYLSAAALHLAIEAPFAALSDVIFRPGNKPSIAPDTLEKPRKISCDSTNKSEKIWTLPFDSRTGYN